MAMRSDSVSGSALMLCGRFSVLDPYCDSRVRALTPGWRGVEVLGLSFCYLIGLAVALMRQGGDGISALLVASIGCFVLDSHGFWTLGVRAQWARPNGWATIGLVML
jgi:hypothetical protein